MNNKEKLSYLAKKPTIDAKHFLYCLVIQNAMYLLLKNPQQDYNVKNQ